MKLSRQDEAFLRGMKISAAPAQNSRAQYEAVAETLLSDAHRRCVSFEDFRQMCEQRDRYYGLWLSVKDTLGRTCRDLVNRSMELEAAEKRAAHFENALETRTDQNRWLLALAVAGLCTSLYLFFRLP